MTTGSAKNPLRAHLLKQRAELPAFLKSQFDRQLTEHLSLWLHQQGSQVSVAAFIGFRGEPDLTPLISNERAVQWFLPVVLPQHQMNFYAWKPGDSLALNRFGTLEPVNRFDLLRPDSQTIFFVPTLGLSPMGVRLGYGGGYYDRYFALYPEGQRVAVLYESFTNQAVVASEFDMVMSGVATELGIRFFGPKKK